MKKEKVLIFEDTATIDKCKHLTQKAVDIINKAQSIYVKWGLGNFTVSDYAEMALRNINPDDHVLTQMVANATGLQKLKIKPEAIKTMISLPDEYVEFVKVIDELRHFVSIQQRQLKGWFIAFETITLDKGIAAIDKTAFEQYIEQFRIYNNNDMHLKLTGAGNAIAKHLTEFQNLLRDIGELSKNGFGSKIHLDERFFTFDENGFRLNHHRIAELTRNLG
jgi:hypothetical protein